MSCFFTQSNHICLLILVFLPLTLDVIIDNLGFSKISTCSLFSICPSVVCLFILFPCLPVGEPVIFKPVFYLLYWHFSNSSLWVVHVRLCSKVYKMLPYAIIVAFKYYTNSWSVWTPYNSMTLFRHCPASCLIQYFAITWTISHTIYWYYLCLKSNSLNNIFISPLIFRIFFTVYKIWGWKTTFILGFLILLLCG